MDADPLRRAVPVAGFWQAAGLGPPARSPWAASHALENILPEPRIRIAALAAEVPPRPAKTIYPEPLASRLAGREKRVLGDLFGLRNFGVNLTRLAPGSMSALRHAHAKQDEFVYVLQGTPTLRTDEGATLLSPGMCAGFRSGTGNAHHLVNETGVDVVYLEIGDRTPGDSAVWPDDDLQVLEIDGKRTMAHRDGTPY
jgi:uncharacterized cupin superfamily protein